MWVDTKIPYELNGQLDIAYNRAMESSQSEWVLLLDHDLFLALNPYWYNMCVEIVNHIDKDVGMITCTTNGNSGRFQEPIVKICKCSDLDYHVELAKEAYLKGGLNLREATNNQLAGYFMLVKKEAWLQVGKFQSQGKGVNKIDHAFCQSLLDNNWRIMVMVGLYVYHRKGVRKLKW